MHIDETLPPSPLRTRRDTSQRLRETVLSLAGDQATLLSHREKNWASVTFAGARHRLELEFAGTEAVAAGELFIAFLPEHEFAIGGHLVADAAITAVDHRLDPPLMRVSCELLLLEEA